MPPDLALETHGLVKSFNGTRAVDGVDLAVAKGEIVGFLGPNGAGKTTVMNIVTGLLKPDAGEVILLGEREGYRRPEVRSRIGCLQEKPRIYPDMTAREYLGFFANLYGVDGGGERIGEVLERVSLAQDADRPLSTFSRGMQQRACLARTLLHRPEFMVLDEPTLGLDPNGVAEMRRIFRELRDEGLTLLFSSHQLDEMERVCDSVVFLRDGQVVAAGRKDDILPATEDAGLLHVELLEEVEPHLDRVRALDAVRKAERSGANTLAIEPALPEGTPIRDRRGAVSRALAAGGLTVLSVTGARMSLEELFLVLTGTAGANLGTKDG